MDGERDERLIRSAHVEMDRCVWWGEVGWDE